MDEGLAVTVRPLVQGGGGLEVKPGVCSAGFAFCLQIEEQTVRMEEEGWTNRQVVFCINQFLLSLYIEANSSANDQRCSFLNFSWL